MLPTVTAVNGNWGHPCMKMKETPFPTMCQRVTWLCTWESTIRDMSSRLPYSIIHSSRLCWIKLRMSMISLQIQSSIFLAVSIFSSLSFAVQALHTTNECLCVSESLLLIKLNNYNHVYIKSFFIHKY